MSDRMKPLTQKEINSALRESGFALFFPRGTFEIQSISGTVTERETGRFSALGQCALMQLFRISLFILDLDFLVSLV